MKKIISITIAVMMLSSIITVYAVTSKATVTDNCVLNLDFATDSDNSKEAQKVEIKATKKDISTGKYVSFNKSNYISVTSSDKLKNAKQITYETWIMPDSGATLTDKNYSGRIFALDTRSIYVNSGNVIMNQQFDNNGTPTLTSWEVKGFKFTPNVWTHVVVAYDSTIKGDVAPTFYINGKKMTAQPKAAFRPTADMATVADKSEKMMIGNSVAKDRGIVADFALIRVYDAILSDKEIADLYNADASDFGGAKAETSVSPTPTKTPAVTAAPTQTPKPTSTPTTQVNPLKPVVTGEFKFMIGNPMAVLNGKGVVLDIAPKVENGVTMVPLRALTEALGLKVEWNEETQTIIIK